MYDIVKFREHEREIIEKLKEQYLLQSDQREYIIQIFGMAQLASTRLSGKIQISKYLYKLAIYICMEYMKYCLQDHIEFIRQQRKQVNLSCLKNLLIQGVTTHNYLQTLHICHGDIKPQNILINDYENPTIFKTCDFDNMVTLTVGKLQPCIMSTQLYHAPEIQNAIRQGQESFHYNPYKALVYSFGLCLLQMHPSNDIQLIDKTAFSNLEYSYGSNIASIIQKMLEYQNNLRPDFQELFQLAVACGLFNIQNQLFLQQNQYNASDILRSQNSNLIRNTPDMYDFLRRESKYPNNQILDSVDTSQYHQLLINNFSEERRESEPETVESRSSQAQIAVMPDSRRCCTVGSLKTVSITVLCLLLLISIFIIWFFIY